MNFENSKTKENLQKALQGEALAHLKYQFYKGKLANTSKQIEKDIEEIIHNEKEHGKIWFKLLHNNQVPDDITNLNDAIDGENYEAFSMYLDFAEEADKEGFSDIAKKFREVAAIEAEHAEQFKRVLKKIEKETLFKETEPVEWKCLNCGYIHVGEQPPEECPVCEHPKKYFTL